LPHLVLSRLGVDDAVLAGDLLAVALLVLRLLLDELLDGRLELVVDDLVLALLQPEAAVCRALRVALQLRDLPPDGCVLELRLCDQIVQLPLRGPVVAR